ncbi:MAG: Hsp20/alpha crystallin family protein [Deltaproteobacteria bacterium]|nr:MAG: Hsp20/alpha crystallin family protein [Deltaproteobacteria bacterium]
MTETKEIQAKEKLEVANPAEQIKPGPVFSPDVDIFENDQEIVLLADMPGVKADHLNIDLRENTLSIVGEISPTENAEEQDIIIEYEVGQFVRQFTLSEVIDQEKIDAKLTDGVLRLTLPKVKKAAPRKISVKAA